jgi:hypothetical protein
MPGLTARVTGRLKDRPLLTLLACAVLFHFANAAMLPFSYLRPDEKLVSLSHLSLSLPREPGSPWGAIAGKQTPP